MSRKIYIIIAMVFTVVLSVSTFFIIRNHIDSAKQNEVYDNLAEIVEDEPPKENEGVTFSEDKDYLAEYLHELARSILVAPADGTEIKLEVRHELVVNLPQGDVRHFIFHFHKFFQPAVSPVIFHQRSRSLADAVQFGSVLIMLLE